MPKLSEKSRLMPASPIRKLVPYAEDAKSRGIKVYHLNIGQPDIETPKCALDAIRNFDEKTIAYSHSAGLESYRRKLAQFYNKYNLNVGYNDILITTGGSEAVIFALMACLNEGDEVLIPEPFYANYNGFAVEAGVNVKPITSSIENDFALPPIEEFERSITQRTKAILLCNPNNPTGYLYSKQEMIKIGDIVKKHDLFLICDEVYRDFCYDDKPFFSCLEIEGAQQNVIMIDSVSKRYSMCGIRIGAFISKNRDIINAALKFGQARLCPPHVAQTATMAALDTPDSYFEDVYKEYLSRRDYMIDALNNIEGVYCPKPKGAFYTVVKLPVNDADKFAQWLLEEFSYNKQTVMLAPASGFYATKGLGTDEVRIAYVLNKEDLKNAIKCMEEALKIYPGRK